VTQCLINALLVHVGYQPVYGRVGDYTGVSRAIAWPSLKGLPQKSTRQWRGRIRDTISVLKVTEMRNVCDSLLKLMNRMPEGSSRAAHCLFALHVTLFWWALWDRDDANLWRATRI